MTATARQIVPAVLRIGLAAVLGIAGALKLGDPTGFATQIANYHLLPSLAPVTAATLPTVEIVLALALVFAPQAWRRSAAAASLPVLVMFLVAVASAYTRGIDIDCGCFGSGAASAASKIGPLTIARNIGLLGMAVTIVWLEGGTRASARSARS